MLVYFKISNYKSVDKEVVVNFTATALNDHSESNLYEEDGDQYLKSILLYGHNASGKSTILNALVYLRWFINNSATDKENGEKIKVKPFEFRASSKKKPSTFEICFILNKKKYKYGVEMTENLIHREWLIESKAKKEYPLFLRIGQEFDVDKRRFAEADGLQKRTRKNVLFLSVCTQWNVAKAQVIDEWFQDFVTIHGLADERYREFTFDLLKSRKYNKVVKRFLQKADLGINDLQVIDFGTSFNDILKRVPEEAVDNFKKKFSEESEPVVFTIHDQFNDLDEKIGQTSLDLDRTGSEGTKKYFNLVGLIIVALLENRFVIIDEFDARLHTLLTKAILRLFNSAKIKSRAQLLVVSHDTALLDRDLLRRDQIYFLDKNKVGATEATSLVEYKPRKETPIDKNYLEGRYGGIPFIDDLESLLEDDDEINSKRDGEEEER